MVKTEFTTEEKQKIWERQSGMCALSGKKFENGFENEDCIFQMVKQNEEDTSINNIVMLWKFGFEDIHVEKNEDGIQLFKKYHFPYANFSVYEYAELLADIKDEVGKTIEFAANSTNLRLVRTKLKETLQTIRNVNLEKEDREPLSEAVKKSFDDVNEKQDNQKKVFEEEATKNFESLQSVVEEVVAFTNETKEFRQAREKLIDVQKKVRQAVLTRENKDAFFEKLNASFESLNTRQTAERENFEMECIDNYQVLKTQVDEAVEFAGKSENFRQGRQKLIEAQGKIKGMKLKRDQREELYATIRACFDGLNQKQSAEREVFEKMAVENFEKIKPVVDEAIKFAETTDDFAAARQTLIAAQGKIKGMKLKRELMEELYASIRTVFDKLNKLQSADREEYETECASHYEKLTVKVEEALVEVKNTSDFGLIRETLLAVQSEIKFVKLKKDQRNELFSRVREAFNLFDEKRKQYRDSRKNQKNAKLTSIVTNLKDKIERLNVAIDRDKESLEFYSSKLNIDAAENGENDIAKKIEDLKLRIEEKNQSLEQSNSRLKDVETEITSLSD